MGFKNSETIEEEMMLVEREIENDDIQLQKKEQLGEDYQNYLSALKLRLIRLQNQYDEEVEKGN